MIAVTADSIRFGQVRNSWVSWFKNYQNFLFVIWKQATKAIFLVKVKSDPLYLIQRISQCLLFHVLNTSCTIQFAAVPAKLEVLNSKQILEV